MPFRSKIVPPVLRDVVGANHRLSHGGISFQFCWGGLVMGGRQVPSHALHAATCRLPWSLENLATAGPAQCQYVVSPSILQGLPGNWAEPMYS